MQYRINIGANIHYIALCSAYSVYLSSRIALRYIYVCVHVFIRVSIYKWTSLKFAPWKIFKNIIKIGEF